MTSSLAGFYRPRNLLPCASQHLRIPACMHACTQSQRATTTCRRPKISDCSLAAYGGVAVNRRSNTVQSKETKGDIRTFRNFDVGIYIYIYISPRIWRIKGKSRKKVGVEWLTWDWDHRARQREVAKYYCRSACHTVRIKIVERGWKAANVVWIRKYRDSKNDASEESWENL